MMGETLSDVENETPQPKQAFMVSPITGATCPTGAHPGNTGGKPGRSGRLPSEVRAASREAFYKRIPRLEYIADGAIPLTEACPECGHRGATTLQPVTDTQDILRAHDLLGKYSGVEREDMVSREGVEESLRIQARIIRQMLEPDLALSLLRRIAGEAW